MKQIAKKLLNKMCKDRDICQQDERTRIGMIEGWLSIAGNLIIFMFKFTVGLISGSLSLMADAIHTASDITSSVVVLIGFRVSNKGPDRDHPYGHGRVEYLTSLAIALMLIGVGVSFAYASYNRLTEGINMSPSTPAIIVTLFSIAAKEFLFHFSREAGDKIESEALLADAWHHRSDSISSLLVLVAVVGAYFNMGLLDTLLSFAVSGFLVYTGFELARRACSRLLGSAPTEETKNNIMNSILDLEDVMDAHDLDVHDYGVKKSITIHIEVDGSLSLEEAHKIADMVECTLRDEHNCHAVVHLDPSPRN